MPRTLRPVADQGFMHKERTMAIAKIDLVTNVTR